MQNCEKTMENEETWWKNIYNDDIMIDDIILKIFEVFAESHFLSKACDELCSVFQNSSTRRSFTGCTSREFLVTGFRRLSFIAKNRGKNWRKSFSFKCMRRALLRFPQFFNFSIVNRLHIARVYNYWFLVTVMACTFFKIKNEL